MITATQLLYQRIGSPKAAEVRSHTASICDLCGDMSACGIPIDDWAGHSFTDWNRTAHGGAFVCEACVYVCARTSPVPGHPPKEGNEHGGSFRNYSHMLDGGTYVALSKGEKPAIRDFLRRTHVGSWFATIADSGQIHMLPFAPVNAEGTRRGLVLFERQVVALPLRGGDGWKLLDGTMDLLTAGATKDEIESGNYTPRAWELAGSLLEPFEEIWAGHRGSPWFALCVWLAQRDEVVVAARMEAEKAAREAKKPTKPRRSKRDEAHKSAERKATDGDGGNAARLAPSVSVQPREEHPRELEHPPSPVPVVRPNHDEPRGMGHIDDAQPQARGAKPRQLELFR